jgi:hypothetical protein
VGNLPVTSHLIRLIHPRSVKYWCGKTQGTGSKIPGKPDLGVQAEAQINAWRDFGRRVCLRCVTNLRREPVRGDRRRKVPSKCNGVVANPS